MPAPPGVPAGPAGRVVRGPPGTGPIEARNSPARSAFAPSPVSTGSTGSRSARGASPAESSRNGCAAGSAGRDGSAGSSIGEAGRSAAAEPAGRSG
ncbi:hypothetical protein AB0F10_36905, partial [Actinoplanes sp. NPDC026623]